MSEWQPIETAPKDADLLLLMQREHVSVGRWNTQEFFSKPKPYWQSERGHLYGKSWDRDHQPTHWIPIPDPPKVDYEKPIHAPYKTKPSARTRTKMPPKEPK